MHAVIVVHENFGYLAGDAGRNERQMTVHICVVRRDGVEGFLIHGMPITAAIPKTKAASAPISKRLRKCFPCAGLLLFAGPGPVGACACSAALRSTNTPPASSLERRPDGPGAVFIPS